MSMPTMRAWITSADFHTSKTLKVVFPPIYPTPLQELVGAAWESFRYLQGLRRSKAYQGDEELASAEHYSYARVVTCAGGALTFPLIVSASLTYEAGKSLFDAAGLRQQFGQWLSQGNSYTTPASGEQLAAAIDGAEEGMRLHYLSLTAG